ncbi:MAG: hypothetical protein JXB50_06085 [Spirochaetes bacterium]|nr:hypothetical protein [Spirochaetota bacterium]
MTKILFNDFTYIIVDIALGSIMALLGILSYGKTKKVQNLFFVISGVFLYLIMAFRVLKKLNIFILADFMIKDIPIYDYLINYFPYIFMICGFIIILKKE